MFAAGHHKPEVQSNPALKAFPKGHAGFATPLWGSTPYRMDPVPASRAREQLTCSGFWNDISGKQNMNPRNQIRSTLKQVMSPSARVPKTASELPRTTLSMGKTEDHILRSKNVRQGGFCMGVRYASGGGVGHVNAERAGTGHGLEVCKPMEI